VEVLGVVSYRASHCFLVSRFSGESLVWSSTTSEGGAMGIYFLLEDVTVSTLTYTRADLGEKPKNQWTGSGGGSILMLLSS